MSEPSNNFNISSALVDFGILSEWMDGQGLPGGAFESVRMLAGGTQNVLIRFERGGRRYVLRRGPPHLRAASNDVIRRESRVLAALAGTDVRHPGFIAGCQDETVMGGAVFFLMEPIDGFNQAAGLPPLHAGKRERFATPWSWKQPMPSPSSVEWTTRPSASRTSAARTASSNARWAAGIGSWKPTASSRAIPARTSPAWRRSPPGSMTHRPASFEPGIMHGDYHLGNVMYAHDSARLAAIVDWEMCTIGDPLLDLGWLLISAAGLLGGGAVANSAAPPTLYSLGGLPTRDEIVQRYAAGSNRDLSAATWYEVLACFKLGIILEGTHARACAGLAPREIGDRLHATTLSLFAGARRLIE